MTKHSNTGQEIEILCFKRYRTSEAGMEWNENRNKCQNANDQYDTTEFSLGLSP